MASTLRLKRGNETANNAFTGVEGELTYDTTLDTVRAHDGSAAGGDMLINEHGSGSNNPDFGTRTSADNVSHITLPSGSTVARTTRRVPSIGSIRFNEDTGSYEGYYRARNFVGLWAGFANNNLVAMLKDTSTSNIAVAYNNEVQVPGMDVTVYPRSTKSHFLLQFYTISETANQFGYYAYVNGTKVTANLGSSSGASATYPRQMIGLGSYDANNASTLQNNFIPYLYHPNSIADQRFQIYVGYGGTSGSSTYRHNRGVNAVYSPGVTNLYVYEIMPEDPTQIFLGT